MNFFQPHHYQALSKSSLFHLKIYPIPPGPQSLCFAANFAGNPLNFAGNPAANFAANLRL
jgi:hypothetical protein